MKITAYRRLASVLITALVALALAAAPGAAPAGAASDAPDTYVLPGTDVYPFGITVLGDQYYATGAINGVLYHGDLRERRASILVPPEQAVPHGRNGIIATGTRLIVTENGDGPPWVSIYQRRTGRLVARFTTGDARSFLAFPGLAPNGDVYVVDARLPRLYRIPAQAITQQQAGLQPLPIYRYLRNTAIYEDPAGYGPNAVIATSDQRFLLMSNNPTGDLYRIRLSDRSVARLNLHGAALTGAAGMVLTAADTLYVVRFTENTVAEIRLDDDYLQARLVCQAGDPRFLTPAGIATAGDRLLIANSQFAGPGMPPWTLTSLPLRSERKVVTCPPCALSPGQTVAATDPHDVAREVP